MAYTSALDVLSLAANPISSVGAIYQDARNLPIIVNVIDQNPRLLSLLPATAKVQSTLRLKVMTRAKRRSTVRVGLDFETVMIEPKSLLGQVPSPRPHPPSTDAYVRAEVTPPPRCQRPTQLFLTPRKCRT